MKSSRKSRLQNHSKWRIFKSWIVWMTSQFVQISWVSIAAAGPSLQVIPSRGWKFQRTEHVQRLESCWSPPVAVSQSEWPVLAVAAPVPMLLAQSESLWNNSRRQWAYWVCFRTRDPFDWTISESAIVWIFELWNIHNCSLHETVGSIWEGFFPANRFGQERSSDLH